MAHEIDTMAFLGKTPWHGLGTALEASDLYDWQRTCAKAGLDWEVELTPLVTADTNAKVTHRAVRRKSDNRILGVVGPKYCPLQNKDAFKWFQPFLDAKEAALHTAGSLCNGSRVWVLAKVSRDPLVIAAGDEVEKFVLLSHGHDGSLAVRVGFTPIRVVFQSGYGINGIATDGLQGIHCCLAHFHFWIAQGTDQRRHAFLAEIMHCLDCGGADLWVRIVGVCYDQLSQVLHVFADHRNMAHHCGAIGGIAGS
jgi:phage/plasmid-like protein (TIGR03299 family)